MKHNRKVKCAAEEKTRQRVNKSHGRFQPRLSLTGGGVNGGGGGGGVLRLTQ